MSNSKHFIENVNQEEINQSWQAAFSKVLTLVSKHNAFYSETSKACEGISLNAKAKAIWQTMCLLHGMIPEKGPFNPKEREVIEQVNLMVASSFKKEL